MYISIRCFVTVFAALRTYMVFFSVLIPGLVYPARYIVSQKTELSFTMYLPGHNLVSLCANDILRTRAFASDRLRSLWDLARE